MRLKLSSHLLDTSGTSYTKQTHNSSLLNPLESSWAVTEAKTHSYKLTEDTVGCESRFFLVAGSVSISADTNVTSLVYIVVLVLFE